MLTMFPITLNVFISGHDVILQASPEKQETTLPEKCNVHKYPTFILLSLFLHDSVCLLLFSLLFQVKVSAKLFADCRCSGSVRRKRQDKSSICVCTSALGED